MTGIRRIIKYFTLTGKRWIISLLLFAVLQVTVSMGLFDRLEMGLYDAWFRLRGVQDPGDQVVIVAMDDASIQKIGPLPWPRTVHAKLLNVLKDARVVGFDLIFDTPTDSIEDKAFASAVSGHGRVVLASQFFFENEPNGEKVQVLNPPQQEIMAGATGLGFVNTPKDKDGVIRRITAVDVNTFEMPFPSLGIALALVSDNINPRQIKLDSNRLFIGNKIIPLDQFNRAMPKFWGPQGTFKTYSYADVLEGKLPSTAFKNKIVLVGATSAASKDTFYTPFTTSNLILSGALETPGVEIHASTVLSFLENNWYHEVPSALNIIFLFIIGVLATFAVGGRGPWVGFLGAITVIVIAGGTAFVLWLYIYTWVNAVAPMALTLLTYTVITASDFVQAEIGRRHTRAVFSRYVSPAVVEEMMRNPQNIALGGHRRTLTMMFCDIRDFTVYSENKEPEQVVKRLNEYLNIMTKTILQHGGTLDKYLGDGLIAFFGAPVHFPDHVERALQAALDMRKNIEKLNKEWIALNEPPFEIGVGINSGTVLVGNVGSLERMDYTVIGEEVNLASRLEGLTKYFSKQILISERSVQMLESSKPAIKLNYLGRVEVKGFSKQVGIYTVDDDVRQGVTNGQ